MPRCQELARGQRCLIASPGHMGPLPKVNMELLSLFPSPLSSRMKDRIMDNSFSVPSDSLLGYIPKSW